MPRPLLTLMTDFGVTDTYVGQMRGALLGINPELQMIDLTHAIEPQNVLQAALWLDDAVDVFPAETIHLVVVDPGVGTERQLLAMELGNQRFVGPDNGVFTAVRRRFPPGRTVVLDRPQYRRRAISSTFHGRDILGPVAAWWSRGLDLLELGTPNEKEPVELRLPTPVFNEEGMSGEILWADHFGNLITNIRQSDWETLAKKHPAKKWELSCGETIIRTFAATYGAVAQGEPLILFGSSQRLEIAINGGSARAFFNCQPGDCVNLRAVTGAIS